MQARGVVLVGMAALLALTLAAPVAAQGPQASQSTAFEAGLPRVVVHPLLVTYTEEFLAHERKRRQRIQGGDLERIQRHYREVVTAQLAEQLSIVKEAGPRVVRVDAVLVDLQLDKRGWLLPAREAFRTAPRAQLVAYVRDSRTGEILGRVGIALRPQPNRLMRDSPGAYWRYMRRVFGRIGTRVRWAIADAAATS
jgi:hypothetical protein